MQLRRIEGTLEFVSNETLTSISGFSKLDYLGGALFFKYNKALESLEGLEGLEAIGGNLSIFEQIAS